MKEWVGDGIPNNNKYDCWQIKTVYDSTVKCSELWVIRLDEIHFILLQTTTSMWWLESPQFNATLYNGRLYAIALCSWECWYKTCPDDEPSCTAFGSLSVNAVCRSVDWSLLRPARGAPSIVMSVSVCLSVCVSVCDHISGIARQISTKFFCMSTWPWLGPPLTAKWYVTYFRFCGWRHICT